MKLLILTTQYADNLRGVFDESENNIFTASMMLAEALTSYAASYSLGTNGFSDEADLLSGNFVFIDNADKTYTYNVYAGNFDEITELAKQIAE